MREARRLSRATATDVEKTQTHPAEAAVFDIFFAFTGMLPVFLTVLMLFRGGLVWWYLQVVLIL